MKTCLRHVPPYLCLLLAMLAALHCFIADARADSRQDAESALLSLNCDAAAEKYPDDKKNLDLVIEVARRYFSSNNLENADKFYLLALQKIRIIEVMLKEPGVAQLPEVSGVQPPSDPQQPVAQVVTDQTKEPESDMLVGSKGVYTVVKADTIRLVAAKLGVTQQHLRSMNNLDAKAYLKIGQELAYNNRKIIPQRIKNGIVINIPDRTLYYFQQGELVTSLPVALGLATKNEKYVWQTPVGKFRITEKLKDPTWTVPPSIQAEMEEQGKEVIASVPPGPENPLGKFAMKTSIPGIMIHSTTKPSSIYSFSSHGCIRLSPSRMEEFFPQIKVNTRGEIIYRPVKIALTGNGRVFLEVHRDIYGKSAGLVEEARQMIEKQKLSDLVDWGKFKAVVQRKNGIAEDISL